MDLQRLQLNELEKGLPGITERFGGFLSEASSYCFTLKEHKSGAKMDVEGDLPSVFQVCWSNEITEQTQRTWNDSQELTEYAATGVALLLTVNLTEFTVIERAPKDGGGFDYWLGNKNSEVFENSARLEISGILEETKTNTSKARIELKKKQVRQRDHEFPAYIVVVNLASQFHKWCENEQNKRITRKSNAIL